MVAEMRFTSDMSDSDSLNIKNCLTFGEFCHQDFQILQLSLANFFLQVNLDLLY